MQILFQWTDGSDKDFETFHRITEEYYSQIVGGVQNRTSFVPYNIITDIKDVLIVYDNNFPIGCASFKKYSEDDAEIKRVWVQPDFRGKHVASDMMAQIEGRAKEKGFKRVILQTREIMVDAVGLYEKLGYERIKNYPPYDTMDNAVCFAKNLI
jgi:ribosomal protein S18 acetylase RimI-like enzyme